MAAALDSKAESGGKPAPVKSHILRKFTLSQLNLLGFASNSLGYQTYITYIFTGQLVPPAPNEDRDELFRGREKFA